MEKSHQMSQRWDIMKMRQEILIHLNQFKNSRASASVYIHRALR